MRLVIIHFYSLFKHGSGSATAAVAACYEAAHFCPCVKSSTNSNQTTSGLDPYLSTMHSLRIAAERGSLCNIWLTLAREFVSFGGIFQSYWSSRKSWGSIWALWMVLLYCIALELTYGNQILAHSQLDSICYSTTTALCVGTAKTTTGCDVGLPRSIQKLISTREIHKLESSAAVYRMIWKP